MKQYFINDLLKSEGLAGESVFVLVKKETRFTRGNKPYLDLILRDRTGEIEAKLWSDNFDRVREAEVGDVVRVEFTVQSYQGKMELALRKIEKTTEFERDDLISVPQNFDLDSLKLEFRKRIDSIRDFHLRKLADAFFDDVDFYQQFIESPAAERVHHDYRHGLLQHVIEMFSIMDGIFKIYPDLNKDLVTTGIFLHDIGKMDEFQMNEVGNTTRTIQGKLIGHIAIGLDMIKRRLPEDFPQSIKTHLFHIILSHQGKLEWGSPIVPATREAQAVFYADLTSTYLSIAHKLRERGLVNAKNKESDDFSEYDKYLGTSIYLGE